MEAILIATFVLSFFIVICPAARGEDFIIGPDGKHVDIQEGFQEDLEDPSASRKITVTCTDEKKASQCKNKLQELKINDQKVFKNVVSHILRRREVEAFFTGKCSKFTETIKSTTECNEKNCCQLKCT